MNLESSDLSCQVLPIVGRVAVGGSLFSRMGEGPRCYTASTDQRDQRRKGKIMKAEIVKSDSGWDLIVKGYGWREIYADYQTIDEAVEDLTDRYPDKDIEVEMILSAKKKEEVI
jgi:hypothetical protein